MHIMLQNYSIYVKQLYDVPSEICNPIQKCITYDNKINCVRLWRKSGLKPKCSYYILRMVELDQNLFSKGFPPSVGKSGSKIS